MFDVKTDVRSSSFEKEGRKDVVARLPIRIGFFPRGGLRHDGDQRYFFNSEHSISIRIRDTFR